MASCHSCTYWLVVLEGREHAALLRLAVLVSQERHAHVVLRGFLLAIAACRHCTAPHTFTQVLRIPARKCQVTLEPSGEHQQGRLRTVGAL